MRSGRRALQERMDMGEERWVVDESGEDNGWGERGWGA
jgi:hypothetical protein